MTQAPPFVVTVIAARAGRLSPARIEEWTRAWRAQCVTLSPGEAWDFFMDAPPADMPVLDDADVIAQSTQGRRKKLLVADMESTIIEQEMLDELADMAGIGPRIADITRRAMNGELDFEGALRERVALLAGLPQAALDMAWGRVTLMPGAAELVATMRAHGAFCALVSGGFTTFTARVRAWLGFDLDQANRLEVREGRLTGQVAEPILGRAAKEEALRRLARERGLDLAETMAVGDGANDLAMLQAAGLGVAFRAKPTVNAQARHKIRHGGLRALLFAQGYRADEIIAPTVRKPR